MNTSKFLITPTVNRRTRIVIKSLNKISLEKLVDSFVKKGGRINKYYLRSTNQGKCALVHLNGWHSGQNIRVAILKALDRNKY